MNVGGECAGRSKSGEILANGSDIQKNAFNLFYGQKPESGRYFSDKQPHSKDVTDTLMVSVSPGHWDSISAVILQRMVR